jgi:predicted metalloprotease with PDZ domain
MEDDLLWVYEGLTEYLGNILTARSGLLNPQQAREDIARLAATSDREPGRTWRPLQDTADAASLLYNADPDWLNWRRSTDFYEEGELLWLDVDTTLRRLTKDKKSMNDFCRAFYGGSGGQPDLKTYTFDDVVAALNSVAPYDWSKFLRTRLDSLSPNTPIESVENCGWKLVYNEQPNEIQDIRDLVNRQVTLSLSIGLTIYDEGSVEDVIYDGPAYKAGIGPGMKIKAVNGQQFSPQVLKDAIDAAKTATTPIQLIVANGAQVETYSIDYHGGLAYPHLERNENHEDFLGDILQPLTARGEKVQ